MITSPGRNLWLGAKNVVEVIQVDVEPGRSPMNGNIYNVSEKGLEWLTRAFGLGREPSIAGLDLMELIDRRQLILMTATESEGF